MHPFAHIFFLTAKTGLRVLYSKATLERRSSGKAFDDYVINGCEILGPAFIKIAQFFTNLDPANHSTRAMRTRLYAEVDPLEWNAIEPILHECYGEEWQRLFVEIKKEPCGSGALAQVHKAWLPDGRIIALKIKRPNAERMLVSNIRTFRRLAKIARLFSNETRNQAMVDSIGVVERILINQADFKREADALLRLKLTLLHDTRIFVPEPILALCRDEIVAMDYCSGSLLLNSPECQRAHFVNIGLEALYHMLFKGGFVHCDLHPGNMICLPDGRLALIDTGATHVLSDSVKLAFLHFFWAIYKSDGRKCAEILIATSQSIGKAHQRDRFIEEMEIYVSGFSDLAASEFDVVAFARGLFKIQSANEVVGGTEFVGAVVSLAVYAGVVRAECPNLHFQQIARPHLADIFFEEYARGFKKQADMRAIDRGLSPVPNFEC